MVGCNQKDDSLRRINFIEESPIAHAIPPSGGVPVFQALDVRSPIGVFAQDGVDVIAELGFQTGPDGGSEAREVFRNWRASKILNGGDEPALALSSISGTPSKTRCLTSSGREAISSPSRLSVRKLFSKMPRSAAVSTRLAKFSAPLWRPGRKFGRSHRPVASSGFSPRVFSIKSIQYEYKRRQWRRQLRQTGCRGRACPTRVGTSGNAGTASRPPTAGGYRRIWGGSEKMQSRDDHCVPAVERLRSVLIWPVAPASSRHWSRQDGGATANLGHHQRLQPPGQLAILMRSTRKGTRHP